jgi:uncharacterized protein (TIGR03086 family)
MQALIAKAAVPAITLVRGVTPDQLDLPTPCADFTVGGLLDHLSGSGLYLVDAAGGTPVKPGTVTPETVATVLKQVSQAWSRPEAWEGQAEIGGQTMPASLMGGMALTELVMHGWDLARAIGAPVEWDAELLDYLIVEVPKTAATGRQLGAYGPAVPVPDDASTLDRLLGMTGRDPQWSPAEG